MPPVILTAQAVIHATDRTRLIRLALGDSPFPFLAGQAILAGLASNRLRKPYSIACSPAQAVRSGVLELLVRIDEADATDPHLERLAPGDAVEVTGPFGSFVLPTELPERELLFIAGGTGIAPLRAMMWDAMERGRGDGITLIYSARRPQEFAYEDELTGLVAEGKITLLWTVTRDGVSPWSGLRGRVSTAILAKALRTTETRCFVCGPPGLVADATDLLREAGVEEQRILSERY